ncbi:MAG: hypothetical protein AABZ60_17130 [Planctomycetota bacterium]
MREWRNVKSGMLGTLLWETRFIYTLFLLFCLVSYGVMGVLMNTRSHFTPTALGEYYRGNEEKDIYGKTFQELLEVTHFHLFSVPVLLFIQGHLFLLTSWPRFLKVVIVLASFLGAALMIAGPWMIFYLSSDLAILMAFGRVLLFLSLILYALVPIYEMWFKRASSSASSSP